MNTRSYRRRWLLTWTEIASPARASRWVRLRISRGGSRRRSARCLAFRQTTMQRSARSSMHHLVMRGRSSCGDRLMNDGGRLFRGGNGFGVQRHVAEQQIGVGGLNIIGAVHLAWHVAGERQNGCVVAARFIKPGDEMRASRPSGAATDGEPTGQLGL